MSLRLAVKLSHFICLIIFPVSYRATFLPYGGFRPLLMMASRLLATPRKCDQPHGLSGDESFLKIACSASWKTVILPWNGESHLSEPFRAEPLPPSFLDDLFPPVDPTPPASGLADRFWAVYMFPRQRGISLPECSGNTITGRGHPASKGLLGSPGSANRGVSCGGSTRGGIASWRKWILQLGLTIFWRLGLGVAGRGN